MIQNSVIGVGAKVFGLNGVYVTAVATITVAKPLATVRYIL